MSKNILAYLLIILAIATRFIPHPANFTAIGAIALFSGLYLNKKQALFLPLIAMFISDIFIGFYSFYIMASVYIGFALVVIIGQQLQNNIKILPIAFGALSGSVLFFLLTNTAVWAFGTMYTHDITGLIASYYSALPFFRNELLGNVFYITTLVGGYEMIKKLSSQTIIATK